MDHERLNLKDAIWVGDSKAQLKEFPQSVQKDIGDALFIAQAGSMSPAAKPFKGVGSGVFEIRADSRTDTYRAVYAVKIGRTGLCAALFSEKIKARHSDPQERRRPYQETPQNGAGTGEEL